MTTRRRLSKIVNVQLFVDIQVDDEDYDGLFKVSFLEVLKLNVSEWNYLVVGCIGSALYGAYSFLYAICFGGINGVCVTFCVIKLNFLLLKLIHETMNTQYHYIVKFNISIP